MSCTNGKPDCWCNEQVYHMQKYCGPGARVVHVRQGSTATLRLWQEWVEGGVIRAIDSKYDVIVVVASKP